MQATRVIVISEGHPVHGDRKLTSWLEPRKSKVELLILLSYFAKVNPDEMLNQNLKRGVFK